MIIDYTSYLSVIVIFFRFENKYLNDEIEYFLERNVLL